MRKPLKKNSIIVVLIITSCAVLIYAIKNETGITGSVNAGNFSTEFILSYTVSNTYDTESYSDIHVIIPFEKHIIHGNIQTGVISEKDILFSQIDVDLNGDNDFNDTYQIRMIKNEVSINEKKISPLIRKTVNYTVMFPFNHGIYNINKISGKGTSFTLRDYSSNPPALTIGLTPGKEIEFMKFKNSIVLIEVILPEKQAAGTVAIEGTETFQGTTNEDVITGGEKHLRFFAAKNVPVKGGTGKGNVKIKNILKPFIVRLTYYFSISETSVLMNQKVIEVK